MPLQVVYLQRRRKHIHAIARVDAVRRSERGSCHRAE